MKPRIYWHYYPKLKRGFYRVSIMPKPYSLRVYDLWRKAHFLTDKLNNQISRELAWRAEYIEQRQLRLTT